MRVFLVQLRKELRELVRTRKLFIVVVVLLAFGLMSPIFAKITPDLLEALGEDQLAGVRIIIPEPSTRDANEQFVKNTTQFGLLLAVLVGFGAIVRERERGQLALIFRIRCRAACLCWRSSDALAILFGVALLVGAIANYAYTVLLFDAPDAGGFLALVALLYVWLLCLIGLTLLASALGRNMTTAARRVCAGAVGVAGGDVHASGAGRADRWGRLLANGMDAPGAVGRAGRHAGATAASVWQRADPGTAGD